MQFLHNLKGEEGVGLVEYGLIVALIAIVSMSSIAAIGHSTSEQFTTASEELSHDSNASSETTTTLEGTSDTTTTLPSGGGGSDDDDEGGLGSGPSTTTTIPVVTTTTEAAVVTTTTIPAPTTTTTTAPSYPTEVAEVDKGTSVIFGYVDDEVVIVDTQTGNDWTVKVTKNTKTRVVLQFKNAKTGKTITTTGYVSKGKLKTKVK